MMDFFELVGLEVGVFRFLVECLWLQVLDEVIGQDYLLVGDGLIVCMCCQGCLVLLILWGLFGVGKMIIVCLLVEDSGLEFELFLAVFFGVVDFKKVFECV